MSLQVTIGIELEFITSYALKDDHVEEVVDGQEPKTLVFDPVPGEESSSINDDGSITQTGMEYRIWRHIGKQIHAAGFPCDFQNDAAGKVENWEIVGDNSVKYKAEYADSCEDPKTYSNLGVEVRSRMLTFSKASLSEVEAVCSLLNRKYRVRNNATTGLHVHVGHSNFGFTFDNLKKLIAFLYTFEPQMSSLHPPHRLNNEYCRSMRENCLFTKTYQQKHGFRPSHEDFVCNVMNHTHRNELLEDIYDHDVAMAPKYAHYNFFGARDPDPWDDATPRTVEFRQHEGTLDGKRVTNWIQVIAGILRFVETCHATTWHNLLKDVHRAEVWEKEGDGRDGQREQYFSSPILADRDFTIIDLLEFIDLPGQAAYYKDKWYLHVVEPRASWEKKHTVIWEYENEVSDNSSEYKRAHAMRQHWESLDTANELLRVVGEDLVPFKSDDELWPNHAAFDTNEEQSIWDEIPGSDVGYDDMNNISDGGYNDEDTIDHSEYHRFLGFDGLYGDDQNYIDYDDFSGGGNEDGESEDDSKEGFGYQSRPLSPIVEEDEDKYDQKSSEQDQWRQHQQEDDDDEKYYLDISLD